MTETIHLRQTGERTRKLTNLEKRNHIMRKIALLFILLALFSPLGFTEDTPKAEVFGGYQYSRVNIAGTGINFNGWNASVTGNFNKYFGVAADFSGAYHSETGGSVNAYTYTFGPVLSLNHEGTINPFVHALFGGAHATLSASGVGSAGTSGFAMQMGGGADARISSRFAIRVIQADWVYYHFSDLGSQASLSKNVRISTGIVLRF